MPPSPSIPSPTPVELSILQVLWRRGPSTVKQIHAALNNDTTLSTTLKMVQVMTEKGLLLKDDLVRPQIFSPAQPAERTQLQLVDELIQRAFAGSAADLVLRAVSANRISPQELSEIRRLIEQARKSSK